MDPAVAKKLAEIQESVARKLENLAEHVREGKIRAFDVAWCVGQECARAPDHFAGMMVANFPAANDLIDTLDYGDTNDTPDTLQDQIAKAMAIGAPIPAGAIEVEDHIPPDDALADGEVVELADAGPDDEENPDLGDTSEDDDWSIHDPGPTGDDGSDDED